MKQNKNKGKNRKLRTSGKFGNTFANNGNPDEMAPYAENFGHQVNSDIHLQTVEIQMRRLLMQKTLDIR